MHVKQRIVRTAALLTVTVLVWCTLGIFLYVLPVTEGPARADVLLVLAPAHERIPEAEHLMGQGYAKTLVISAPVVDSISRPPLCAEKRAYQIICFSPDPVTTQGEARALRSLSEEYGWDSANVLTAQFHVTRARVIMERCYKGNLSMTAFRQSMPVLSLPEVNGSWAYHFAYESAAFVKVALNPGC